MHWDFQNVHFLIARMSSGHFLKRCISPSKCTSHEFCHMYILSHSHTCAAVTTCLSQSYTCVQHHPQHAYISAAIFLNCSPIVMPIVVEHGGVSPKAGTAGSPIISACGRQQSCRLARVDVRQWRNQPCSF